MFSTQIIDSDAFLEMPLSSQTLYFHLSMRADDDGFINNPKRIQRMIGASDDDLKLLIAKSFVLAFDSGVLVIKHWRINNYIRSDRYKPTLYSEEMQQLGVKANGSYTFNSSGIPLVYQTDTKYRLDKSRLDKNTHTLYGRFDNVKLTAFEYDSLEILVGTETRDTYIDNLSIYKEKTGKQYESDNATILEWMRKDGISID